MKDHEEVRKSVAEAYAKLVTGPKTGCCGGGRKSAIAEAAGYEPEELAKLPVDAVTNSFGCGNPMAFVGVKPGEVVLDLGSGAGIDLLIAADKVGPEGRVIGIDMTDEMIERARKNIEASNRRNVEVRKGIIEELPVEDASVDWVISNCVINLSPAKERVFAEIARVLKPGGQVSVSDIVVDDLPDWVRRSASAYSSCVAGAISEKEYVEGLERAGLVGVEVRERLVYGKEQVEYLAGEVTQPATSCCGDPLPEESVLEAAASVVGKVASAKFYARKPAS